MIVARCPFCERSFTLERFLALPLPPKAIRTGIDYSELPDGGKCIFRDCDCLPPGERNTVGAIVNAAGQPEPG